MVVVLPYRAVGASRPRERRRLFSPAGRGVVEARLVTPLRQATERQTVGRAREVPIDLMGEGSPAGRLSYPQPDRRSTFYRVLRLVDRDLGRRQLERILRHPRMSNTPSTPHPDVTLFAAEREIGARRARLREVRAAGDRCDHPEITDRALDLDTEIAVTPATDPCRCGRQTSSARRSGNRARRRRRSRRRRISRAYTRHARRASPWCRCRRVPRGRAGDSGSHRWAGAVDAAYCDCEERLAPIHDRYDAAVNLIDRTAPQSPPAVIVKLRRLRTEHSSLADDDYAGDSLRQVVVSFLERQIGAQNEAPEVIGFGERDAG
jgi:hypothetical protein